MLEFYFMEYCGICSLLQNLFLIIYYKKRDEYYYMRLRELEIYTKRVDEGGRKSIPLSELSGEYFFKASHGMYVPYLEMIKKDLDERQA